MSSVSQHFRINLESFGESYDERQLLQWANRFFVEVTWSKPVMHAKTNDSAYTVKKLQQQLSTNLRRWGAKSSSRYCRQWVVMVSPWEFAQSSPAKAMIAEHRLNRLAAILSPAAKGLRSLKANAEPALAQRALEKAQADCDAFYKEFDRFKLACFQEKRDDPEGHRRMMEKQHHLEALGLAAHKRCQSAASSSDEPAQKRSR